VCLLTEETPSHQGKKPHEAAQTLQKQPAFLTAPPTTTFPAAATAQMGGGEKSGLAQLVLPSLVDGAGLHNIMSAAIGVPAIAVVIAILVVTVAALGSASSRVLRMPRRWVAAVFAATIAAQLLWLGWRGAATTTEVELMRAQVLQRLGYESLAERIERDTIEPGPHISRRR
jgi:hypothetical protein